GKSEPVAEVDTYCTLEESYVRSASTALTGSVPEFTRTETLKSAPSAIGITAGLRYICSPAAREDTTTNTPTAATSTTSAPASTRLNTGSDRRRCSLIVLMFFIISRSRVNCPHDAASSR